MRESPVNNHQFFYSSGIENEHEVYSLAQLEARPSLTTEASSNSNCGAAALLAPLTCGEERIHNKNTSAGLEAREIKVQQKPTKTVRIVEPPKAPKVRVKSAPPPPVGVPIQLAQTSGSFVTSANRPRSVTDALFAAAPEVVVAAQQGPTPSAAVAAAAERRNLLPEDMSKGFLQFAAEVDPELTSKWMEERHLVSV